jgi:hypothetical protein
MSSISESEKSSWMDVTNESVHTSDDVDIGDIEAINRDFIVIKRGYIHVHRYYIPIAKVEGWDGHVVWLKVTEDEVKKNYERNGVPDPSRYYIQGYPYDEARPYTKAYFPEMPIIEAKGRIRTLPSITSTEKTRAEALGGKAAEEYQQQHMSGYNCALCDSSFNTEEELSGHVTSSH